MKTLAKVAAAAAGLIVVLLVSGFAYVELTYDFDHPNTPLPNVQASKDPAVIAQGKYIVDNVAHCSTCHADPVAPGTHEVDITRPLTGGHEWKIGPFGTFVAANLTPDPETGLGGWTDGEIARAIRHSVGRDGRLLAFMRVAVGPLSDADLTAVVSYLRSLEPVKVQRARDEYGFLAKALSGSFLPRMETVEYAPAGTVSTERGRYLAEGPGMCAGCHTPADPMKGFAYDGPMFSGASEPDPDFTDEQFEIIPPNITAHASAGVLGQWTEDQFVERFRRGRVFEGSKMPWEAFMHMQEDDLRSIYRYLKSVPPSDRQVGPSRRLVGTFKG